MFLIYLFFVQNESVPMKKRQTSLQKELGLTRGSIEITLHVFQHLDKVSSLCQCLHVNQLFSKQLNPLKYVIASCSFKVICFKLVVCTIRSTSIITHRVYLAMGHFCDLWQCKGSSLSLACYFKCFKCWNIKQCCICFAIQFAVL